VCCSEEVWLCGVERYRLNDAFSCAEGSLTCRFANTVDQHLTRRLDVVSYRRKIVTLLVPADFTDHILQGQSDRRLNFNLGLEQPSTWSLSL